MKQPGPPLQALLHHLTECPPEFQEIPLVGNTGVIQVAAVVSDLLQDMGGAALQPAELAALSPTQPEELNRLRLVLLTCWILFSDLFEHDLPFAVKSRALLLDGLRPLASKISAEKFLSDPERREELIRITLRALELRPQGETIPQSMDRLQAIDTVERQRVLDESKRVQEAVERRRAELRAKAEAEAAAKVSRE